MTRNANRTIAVLVVVAIVAIITLVIPYCSKAEYPFVYVNTDVKTLYTAAGAINVIATIDKDTEIIRVLISKLPESTGKTIVIKEISDRDGLVEISSNAIKLRDTYVLMAYPLRKRNMVVYMDGKPMFMIIRR